jgi:CxxC motif-containing protein (DUF1111 family)
MFRWFQAAAGPLVVLVSSIAVLDTAVLDTAAYGQTDPIAGRILFERVWATHGNGSGPLGPLYNERSCAACHSLGGVGGAGPNSKNVDLLSVDVPEHLRLQQRSTDPPFRRTASHEAELSEIRRRLPFIHSGLTSGSMVLHTYGVDPRYGVFREQVLGLLPMVPRVAPNPEPPTVVRRPVGAEPLKRIELQGVRLLLSGRNSTAMFGAGLIDKVSQYEIIRVVNEQTERHPDMKGRFLGRFGWRGQTLDLKTFVGGACGVEVGLNVPGVNAPDDPVAETISRRQAEGPNLLTRYRTSTTREPELDQRQFADLVAFVASLPAPVRREPNDIAEIKQVRRGEAVFESVQCGVCHRESIGKVSGIYSDLLLHDLGPGLYDPQPPPTSARGSLYYGSDSQSFGDFVDNRHYEWRTPPLWGLADSGPYLHDGRAATVENAIESHGGQAASSLVLFRELSESDRQSLLAFLATLVAPDAPGLKQPHAQSSQSADSSSRELQPTTESAEAEKIERLAESRLRLGLAARGRGDADIARLWLEAVVIDFPTTKAAVKASALLNP